MNAAFQLLCLGRFDILTQDNGSLHSLPKPPTLKSQSLLAYLIYHRQQQQTRDKLTGLFWGDRLQKRARRSLSNALTHIRHCFPGVNPIEADNQWVQFVLEDGIWLDAERFVSEASRYDLPNLHAAVSRYNGDFLPGFYDDWVIDERYRLQALYLECLTRLMALYETQGQYRAALEIASQLLHEDALREDAHRVSMRAYSHLGQRNAALAQYRQCSVVVKQELGIRPTAETISLYEAIRDDRFKTRPVVQSGAVDIAFEPVSGLVGHNPLDVAAPNPLVGREEELAFLGACWGRAQADSLKAVFVQGEAGVGKSHLVETFVQNLRTQGVLVLSGCCYEFERLLPYQPVVEVLRPWLLGQNPADLANLPDWLTAELGWLMPDVFSPPSSSVPSAADRLHPVDGGIEAQARTRLFHAIAYLVGMLADRSLLIVLEDMHWATESTLQLVHYLIRYLTRQPAMLVAIYRRELVGRNHPLARIGQQLGEEGSAERLALERLSPAAVEKLVVEISAAGKDILPLARQLYQETEGNPFYLVETLKMLFESGALSLAEGVWQGPFNRIDVKKLPVPAGIHDAILTRVRRLSSQTQAGLRLAAVLGREFDYDLLNATWGQGEEVTLSLLDDLLRARLISEGQGKTERDYLFGHHKIQEVIYADVPARRRQHFHAQVGEVMERLYADQLDTFVPEMAYHFDQGRKLKRSLRPKAADYLQRAGIQAAAQYAHTEAVAYFTRALALIPTEEAAARYELLMSRVRLYDIQGERPLQKADLDSLAAIAGTMADARRQAEIARLEGGYYLRVGDYPAAIEASKTAVQLAKRYGVDDLQAIGYWQMSDALAAQGAYEKAIGRLEQAILLARNGKMAKIEADCLRSLGRIYLHQGDYEKARTTIKQALAIFRHPASRSGQGEAQALRTLGNIRRNQGDYAAAQDYYERSMEISHQIGDRYNEATTFNNLGVIHWDQSDFETAEKLLLTGVELCREVDDLAGEGFVLNNLGRLLTERGKLAQAGEHLQRSLAIQREVREQRSEAIVLQSLAYIYREQGAYQTAIDLWQQSLQIRREIGDRRGEGYVLRGLAESALIPGDFSQVEKNLQLAMTIFEEIGEQRGLGEAWRGLGMMATRVGDYGAALDYFRESLTILSGGRDEAYVFLHLSLLYHMMGDDETAAEYCQNSLRTAEMYDIRLLWASALTYWGHFQAGLGNLTQAMTAFEKAMTLRRETGQLHLAIEPLAGMAGIYRLQDNMDEALKQLDEVWGHLAKIGFDGAEHTIRVYHLCFEVWETVGDLRTAELLKTAYHHLQQQAATISNKTYRHTFLEKVPHHRALVKAYLDSRI